MSLSVRLLGPRVFLISASLLAFEVVLLRLFAVQTFHHFAYMAIGVALLGFAAAGTALVLGRRSVEGREAQLFRLLSALLPVALLAAPVLGRLPGFEPTQFLWDWRPWASITVLYACLALPFFVGAGAITLALMRAGPSVGHLYAWNMVGSGFGGLLAIGLLFPFPPDQALAATIVPTLPVAAAGLLELASSRGRGRRPTPPGPTSTGRATVGRLGAWAGAAMLCAGVVLAAVRPPWTLSITSFKGLPQVEAFQGATRVGERWGPTGWVTGVRTPAFHHAPGLSLGFQGELPEQVALFVDGETAGGVTVLDAETAGSTEADQTGAPMEGARFLDWLPSAAPYALGRPASVLVLGSGDGLQVLSALTHGAERVTAVELVEPLVRLADEVVEEESRVYSHPRVRTVLGDARGFAARTDERYDLIVLTASGTFAAGASGVHGTGENYVETVEAYRRYLELLEPGGTLAVTRWLRTPPRDNVKLIFTVDEALRRSGVAVGEQNRAFLRSWATATLLVRPDGFDPEALDRLRAFATSRLFDVDWPVADGGSLDADAAAGGAVASDQVDAGPRIVGGAVQHNVLERPVFREALQAANEGEDVARRFRSAYAFDVSPATDDRPYFGQFLRLTSLPALLAEERGAWLPVAEWGYLAVVATLVQSGLLSLLLLGLPVVVLARSGEKEVRIGRTALYFGAVGFGFIFLELAIIQRLGLVLGHPVFATSATLGALLVFSGLGSAGSDRVPVGYTGIACAAVAVSALVLGVGSGAAEAFVSLPLPARAAAALAVLAVPGVLMGVPFPLGLRKLAPEAAPLAWAWAANGVASVMGASAATLLAMEVGGSGLLIAGGVCYLAAAGVVSVGGAKRRGSG